MTVSVRLEGKLAKQLERAAKALRISKSELIRQSLEQFLHNAEQAPSAYALGKELFGCYRSGEGDLSKRVEEIVRERIHAEHSKTQTYRR